MSGDSQKKETEIIRKIEQPVKTTKTEKFENILKNDVSLESEKNVPSASLVEVPRRRRFLDFYFEDAIAAENIRLKSLQTGNLNFLFSFLFSSSFLSYYSFLFSFLFLYLFLFLFLFLFLRFIITFILIFKFILIIILVITLI